MIDFQAAFPNSRKVYEERSARLTADGPETALRVPMREVTLGGGEPPIRLYDNISTCGKAGEHTRSDREKCPTLNSRF